MGVATGAGDQTAPVLAFDGRQHLVVWQQAGADTGVDLWGRAVDGSGRPNGPAFAVAAGAGDETGAAVAVAGPGRFLVVYQRFDPVLGQTRVRARMLTR